MHIVLGVDAVNHEGMARSTVVSGIKYRASGRKLFLYDSHPKLCGHIFAHPNLAIVVVIAVEANVWDSGARHTRPRPCHIVFRLARHSCLIHQLRHGVGLCVGIGAFLINIEHIGPVVTYFCEINRDFLVANTLVDIFQHIIALRVRLVVVKNLSHRGGGAAREHRIAVVFRAFAVERSALSPFCLQQRSHWSHCRRRIRVAEIRRGCGCLISHHPFLQCFRHIVERQPGIGGVAHHPQIVAVGRHKHETALRSVIGIELCLFQRFGLFHSLVGCRHDSRRQRAAIGGLSAHFLGEKLLCHSRCLFGQTRSRRASPYRKRRQQDVLNLFHAIIVFYNYSVKVMQIFSTFTRYYRFYL